MFCLPLLFLVTAVDLWYVKIDIIMLFDMTSMANLSHRQDITILNPVISPKLRVA